MRFMTFTTFQKSGKRENGKSFCCNIYRKRATLLAVAGPRAVPGSDGLSLSLSHTRSLSLTHKQTSTLNLSLSRSLSLWQVNVPFLDLMASLVEGIGGVDGALPLSLSLAFSLSLSLVLPPLSL